MAARRREPADEHRDAPRRTRATVAEQLQPDDFKVRIFALADHAAAPPDGKLYINGAGIDRMLVVNPNAPLTPFFVVARVAVPYTMMSEQHRVTVRLLDADRQAVLPAPAPDPLIDVTGETGRPPGTRPGDDVCLQLAIGLHGVPVPSQDAVYFHLAVDGRELAVLPLRIYRQGPG